MSKIQICPVCRYINSKAPALLLIEVRDAGEKKRALLLCPRCLTVWLPEEIPPVTEKKKGRRKKP